MLMPIVSMNKMAMNESVAATCCYRERASATNVYWETMNGGWIGSGYVNKIGWKSDSYKAWASFLGYDVKSTLVTDGKVLPFILTKQIDATGKEVMMVKSSDPLILDVVPLDTFWGDNLNTSLGTASLSRGADCKHADGLCAYKTEGVQFETNYHWGSTARHTTDGGSFEAHTAKQFNS